MTRPGEYKNTLERKRDILVDSMDPIVVMDVLRSKCVLTFRQANEIKQEKGIHAQVGALLDCLLRKDNSVFEDLLGALRGSNQGWLADQLEANTGKAFTTSGLSWIHKYFVLLEL